MSSMLIVAWVHGCIGLYFWLRMKVFYRRAAPYLLAAAVLIPTLACSASIRAGATWSRPDGSEMAPRKSLAAAVGTPAQQAVLEAIDECFLTCYVGLLGVARRPAASAPLMNAGPAWSTCPTTTAAPCGCQKA